MRMTERATPIVAIIAAFSSLACCLPFTFVGAAGLMGASPRSQAMRPWLLLASAVLLIIGFAQLYFRKQCRTRSRLSVAIFWIATAVVLLLTLFPQIAASILAG